MDSYMHNRPSSAMKMKVSTTRKMVEDEEDDMEEEEMEEDGGNQGHELGGVEYNLKKTKLSGVGVAGEKGFSGGGGGVAKAVCQVEKCEADLSDAKKYHKRHKVCEDHAKAAVVIVAGSGQRFCQQCSRFHVVSEFDDAKRSCRRRLAGHNERRRKSSSECRGEGSNRRGSNQFLKENQCIQVDESRNSQRAFPGGSSLKNFHIH